MKHPQSKHTIRKTFFFLSKKHQHYNSSVMKVNFKTGLHESKTSCCRLNFSLPAMMSCRSSKIYPRLVLYKSKQKRPKITNLWSKGGSLTACTATKIHKHLQILVSGALLRPSRPSDTGVWCIPTELKKICV